MLKLSASYSKKVPAGMEYSSQSYHACVEVELSDGLSAEELQERIHNTFELVRDSVENEIQSGNDPCEEHEGSATANGSNGSNGSKNGNGDSEPASPKQVKYLLDLARQKRVDLKGLLTSVKAKDAGSLTRKQCSHLIDELQQGHDPSPSRKCWRMFRSASRFSTIKRGETPMQDKFLKGGENVSGDDVRTVLEKSKAILKIVGAHMRSFIGDVALCIEMLRAYFKGWYPFLPAMTVAAIVLALLYILNPIDAIPDFIPMAGFTDDIAVLAACLAFCKKDVDKFKKWREGNPSTPSKS